VLIRITAPHFCAGIARPGACAPILAYMRSWSVPQIEAYCARKGWWLEVWFE
jgi:hypothetical protein